MTWLWVALVVAVLGLTAAVAVGRGGALARAYPDRPDVRLPAGRPLTADDLSDVDFSVVLRGYRMDEVDEVIRRLVHEIAARDARLARLGEAGHGAVHGHRADPGRGASGLDGPSSVDRHGITDSHPGDGNPRQPGHRATGDVLVGDDPSRWHAVASDHHPDRGHPDSAGPHDRIGYAERSGYPDSAGYPSGASYPDSGSYPDSANYPDAPGPAERGSPHVDDPAALLDPWSPEPVDTPDRGSPGQSFESSYPPHPGEDSGRHARPGES
jgi:DivIVA domain-containing protein